MRDRIEYLREIAQGLDTISANEQHIGHFQMAVKDALFTITEELEYLRNLAEGR